MDNRYAIILAGGKGERFWPLSTSKHPKQFLSLVGNQTLLAQAVERLDGVLPYENIFVITNAELNEVARKAAPQLPAENIIGEPIGRDTAAAIALGAAVVKSKNKNAVFAVFTADHIIADLDLFKKTVEEAYDYAAVDDVLVTMGIKPAFASTGYGYIQAGKELKACGNIVFHKAVRFVEKPEAQVAEEYMNSGEYFWNSGMFIWSVKSIQKAFETFRKPLSDMMNVIVPVCGTDRFDQVFAEEYDKLERISIDYAVMENADNVVMVKGLFAWDDVGSWPALENHFSKDADGNTLIGEAVELDSKNNIVLSKDRLTALIGVNDLIVVHAEGASLVCHKDHAQDIKKVVQQLRTQSDYQDLV